MNSGETGSLLPRESNYGAETSLSGSGKSAALEEQRDDACHGGPKEVVEKSDFLNNRVEDIVGLGPIEGEIREVIGHEVMGGVKGPSLNLSPSWADRGNKAFSLQSNTMGENEAFLVGLGGGECQQRGGGSEEMTKYKGSSEVESKEREGDKGPVTGSTKTQENSIKIGKKKSKEVLCNWEMWADFIGPMGAEDAEGATGTGKSR